MSCAICQNDGLCCLDCGAPGVGYCEICTRELRKGERCRCSRRLTPDEIADLWADDQYEDFRDQQLNTGVL